MNLPAPIPARRTDARTGDLDIEALITAQEPTVLEGLVAHWPLVQKGMEGPRAALDHLAAFDIDRTVAAFQGAPAIAGRFHYDDTLGGLNFTAGRLPLAACLARLREALDDADAPSLYVGSADIEAALPGLAAQARLPVEPQLAPHNPLVSIWIGGRTTAAAHWDMSNNLACCAVGRRRFTLFPPNQAANLYPGPLEPTPAGQVVSMVDVRAPDLKRYPRYREALATARVAELGPGDAIIYPALWWHEVEALEPVNVLVNWWWNTAPAFMDTPMTTLLHGLLSLRDRPQSEKEAWRALFDYYVFGSAERAGAHLPPTARGPLAPLDATAARRLRAQIQTRLNR